MLVSPEDDRMKFLFSMWCKSISGDINESFFAYDQSATKCALRLKRSGLRFFRMKHEFWFDCFYLVETYDKTQINRLTKILEPYIGYYTKKSFRQTCDYFLKNKQSRRLPSELISHRSTNIAWRSQMPKKVLVVAKMSAGKSTLINAIVGHKIAKTRTTACTNRLCQIFNKPMDDGLVYAKGSSKISMGEFNLVDSETFVGAACKWNSTISKPVCLIDTPGINNTEYPEHKRITEEAIESNEYDMLIYVGDGRYLGTTDELDFLTYIRNKTQKPIVFVLNQLDCFNPEEDSIEKACADYKTLLQSVGFKNNMVIPVSALAGWLFKQPLTTLSKYDKERRKILETRMKDNFYNLPSYLNSKDADNVLNRTGIPMLEQTILKDEKRSKMSSVIKKLKTYFS